MCAKTSSKRNRPHRARGWITLLILALLSIAIMALSLVLARQLSRRAVPESGTGESVQTLLTGGFTVSDPGEAARLYPLDGGVLKVDTHRVSYLNMAGVEQWGTDIAMTSPLCCTGDTYALIADLGGSSYLVVDRDGRRIGGTAPGDISGASAGPDGRFAMVVEQPDNYGLVRVLWAAGGREYEWDFLSRQSGYVLSAAFTPDGRQVDISAVDLNRTPPQSVLIRMDTESGAQVAQFAPSSAGLFGLAAYPDHSGTVVLAGQHILTGFAADATEQFSHTLARIDSLMSTEYGVLTLGADAVSDPPSLRLLDPAGVWSEPYVLTETPTAFCVSGSYAMLGTGTTLDVFELSPFRHVASLDAEADILRIGSVRNDSAVLVTRDGAGLAAFR